MVILAKIILLSMNLEKLIVLIITMMILVFITITMSVIISTIIIHTFYRLTPLVGRMLTTLPRPADQDRPEFSGPRANLT